ncbi:YheC/YheD family endospore coat-associated protein [Cohnella fermenti]|uniref:YheC/YheD family protein n=1 Tax=Cohnella fermenti TaxID=2565925 RepID=A0A4V3WGH1_9BACL|nr:YheC/YheD family protein [Cohnella fermenti]THF83753.1 YheC/YheD family protein [Cohnella fermenti]
MPVICPVSREPFSPSPPPSLSLGVAVCEREGSPPFAEASFIRRLAAAGPRHGLRVFAFSPWTLDEESGTVTAWLPAGSSWSRETVPAPSLVYDRAWPGDPLQRRRFRSGLRRLQGSGRARAALLNGRLPGKLGVFRVLKADARTASLLPPTAEYEGPDSLADWLSRHNGAAFLKPSNGSKGRRVIAVSRHPDDPERLRVRGRNGANVPFRIEKLPAGEALGRIDRAIGGRPYIMQPYLDLRGPTGESFDMRVLMQRDGNGGWTEAGIAARIGRFGSVTSNLHGGGTAANASDYLRDLFGDSESASLLGEMRRAARDVIGRLEGSYGIFCELGLDFGIDRSGRLWFLEANTKPGRASMACAGESAAASAVERPLAYARYILLRPPGRVFHEFDPM